MLTQQRQTTVAKIAATQTRQRFVYVNERIEAMINLVGNWALENMQPVPANLRRKAYGADDAVYSYSTVIRIAVNYSVREMEQTLATINQLPARDRQAETDDFALQLQGYLLEYANAVNVQRGERRLVTLYADTLDELQRLHKLMTHVLPVADTPVLMTRSRWKATNDIPIITAALARMAHDIAPDQYAPCLA